MSGGIRVVEWIFGKYRTVGYWWTPSIGRGHLSIRFGWCPFQRDENERWKFRWPFGIRWVGVTRRLRRKGNWF